MICNCNTIDGVNNVRADAKYIDYDYVTDILVEYHNLLMELETKMKQMTASDMLVESSKWKADLASERMMKELFKVTILASPALSQNERQTACKNLTKRLQSAWMNDRQKAIALEHETAKNTRYRMW